MGRGHRLVEAASALGATGDQQVGLSVLGPKVSRALPRSLPVEVEIIRRIGSPV
jgi:hypothetical protein